MKRTFTFLTYFFTLITISSEAQWNNSAWGSTLNGNASGSGGFVSIYSSLKSVDGGNFTAIKVPGTNYEIESVNVNALIAQVPLTKRLKAKAGEPFTIDVHTAGYAGTNFANPAPYLPFWNVDTSGIYTSTTNPKMPNGIGQSGDLTTFSEFFSWEQKTPLTYYAPGSVNYENYKKEFVFTKGSNTGYIVFRLEEREYEDIGFGGALPTLNSHTTVLLIPFVVEGPVEREIPILGVVTKPKIPHMVIHRPPGDMSTAFITSGQKTCRNFEETFQYENDLSGYASIKWGVKAEVGIIVTQELEAYVQATGSIGGGDVKIESSSKETCVETESTITMNSVDDGSQGGDLFIGYGFDAEYGFGNNLYIDTDFTVKYNKGIYLVQLNPVREFAWSESGIRGDMAANQLIAANTSLDSVQRTIAQNQVEAWQRVLALNDENKLAAKASTPIDGDKVIEGGEAFKGYSKSVDFTVVKGIETSSYFTGGIAVDFLAEYGGAGISGGVNFNTTNTFSEKTENTASNSTTIGYELKDGDIGDNIPIRIYRDPMFGTPVFDILSGARTSAPYEGGYQRDQPRLEIVGVSGNTTNINNVTLGSPATFKIKVCNDNSTEQRTYHLGFETQSNSGDLLVTANGSSGFNLGQVTVPANGCRVEEYQVNLSRRYATSEMSFSDLKFKLYPIEDTEIEASILANVNWATPPPPTLGPLPLENRDRFILLCQGVQDLTLTTTCTNGTVPHWYTSQVGGLEEGQGSPFVLTNIDPSIRTNYYVSCESDNYISPRVLFGRLYQSYEPTVDNLNLTGYTHFGYYVANETLEVSAYNNNTRLYPTAFRAGNSVTLLPGFETLGERGLFSAEIGGCP